MIVCDDDWVICKYAVSIMLLNSAETYISIVDIKALHIDIFSVSVHNK